MLPAGGKEENMSGLGRRQADILQEALCRYKLFHQGEELTTAWTGLGTATFYGPVAKGGYMEMVHGPNPGYDVWWRLTRKGAAIVQLWLQEESEP